MVLRPAPKAKRKPLTKPQRKRLRPELYCADADAPRCYKAPTHISRCTTHAKAHLDDLQRPLVVKPDSVCEAAAWHRDLFPCGGRIQVNHGIEREYLLTRWLPENVLPGCAALNTWAHYHKREWNRMLKDWWGVPKYTALEDLALSRAKPDYDAYLAALSPDEERAA